MNLSHGEFLLGSSEIFIQRVDSLLLLLCSSNHLLFFLSEGGNLFPVAFNIVLQHLIPDETKIRSSQNHLVAIRDFWFCLNIYSI